MSQNASFTFIAVGFMKPQVRRLVLHAQDRGYNVKMTETKTGLLSSHFKIEGDYIPTKALYDVIIKEADDE